MLGHVAVRNLAAFVLDDKKAIQHTERHRRHRKEISAAITSHAMQISGHGPLRNPKAKLLQFRMNLGSAPVGIFFG
jgi:hypothetical protein